MILTFLLFIIYLDVRILKEHNRGLFGETFRFSYPAAILVFLALFLLLAAPIEKSQVFSLFFFVLLLPLYLLRRQRFMQLSDFLKSIRGPLVLLSDALGVVLLWLFTTAVLEILVSTFLEMFIQVKSELLEILLTNVLSSLVILIFIYRASQKFSKEGFLANMRLRLGKTSRLKTILLPLLLGLFFAYVAVSLTFLRGEQPKTPLSEVLEATQSTPAILGFLALAVLLAPLIEEIIFRGYFFYVVNQMKGSVIAVSSVALAFAFLHVGQYWGDWLAIGMVTILGFVLTLLRAWSGSTVAGIVMHYMYNAGVVVISIIMILAHPELAPDLIQKSLGGLGP